MQGSGAGTIDVFLADDNLIVRAGVKALIDGHPDMRVVAVASDYDEVLAGAAATSPHVLVTDILMRDTVTLAQRLQQLADPGEIVMSDATLRALLVPIAVDELPSRLVKGRDTPVVAFKMGAQAG